MMSQMKRTHIEVIGEAADGRELVQMVWKLHPDVVLRNG